jgi:nucleotide-binding universal stress UspA family protein
MPVDADKMLLRVTCNYLDCRQPGIAVGGGLDDVVSTPNYAGPLSVGWATVFDPEASERWLRSELADVTDHSGVDVHVKARPGSPARQLAAAVAEFRADALVIGAPAPFRRYFAGSVPAWLVRRARCPVIVVPLQLDKQPAMRNYARGGRRRLPRRTGGCLTGHGAIGRDRARISRVLLGACPVTVRWGTGVVRRAERVRERFGDADGGARRDHGLGQG